MRDQKLRELGLPLDAILYEKERRDVAQRLSRAWEEEPAPQHTARVLRQRCPDKDASRRTVVSNFRSWCFTIGGMKRGPQTWGPLRFPLIFSFEIF